jgi:PHD/YefM family antitoxin component YafN of YafNO toxin-antitoxin module
MNTVLPTIPISDLRSYESQVIDQMNVVPVVLTRRGRAAAVLVSPEQWNQLIEELDDMADALAVMQSRLDRALGREELLDWADVKAEIVEMTPDALHR